MSSSVLGHGSTQVFEKQSAEDLESTAAAPAMAPVATPDTIA
jgi:hypothetical protein